MNKFSDFPPGGISFRSQYFGAKMVSEYMVLLADLAGIENKLILSEGKRVLSFPGVQIEFSQPTKIGCNLILKIIDAKKLDENFLIFWKQFSEIDLDTISYQPDTIEKRLKNLRKLAKTDLTNSQLAEKLAVSVATITRDLRKLGIKRREARKKT